MELSNHGFAESPEDKTVQAVEFKEAPPPDLTYPINDVIAQATDLDGNHVVMRRGYCNAATKEVFGRDKIYWKHGRFNPDVFKDLISHSRPKANQGGSLVYEVRSTRRMARQAFSVYPVAPTQARV